MTVTASLVEAVLDLAQREHATKVVEVHLKVGKLRALSIEQLKFCYDILSKQTILEGSKLLVDETPGKVRCSSCDYAGEVDSGDDAYHFGVVSMVCPKCANMLEIEGGDECVISKVRMTAGERSIGTIKT